jgi:hypothetical protein
MAQTGNSLPMVTTKMCYRVRAVHGRPFLDSTPCKLAIEKQNQRVLK